MCQIVDHKKNYRPEILTIAVCDQLRDNCTLLTSQDHKVLTTKWPIGARITNTNLLMDPDISDERDIIEHCEEKSIMYRASPVFIDDINRKKFDTDISAFIDLTQPDIAIK